MDYRNRSGYPSTVFEKINANLNSTSCNSSTEMIPPEISIFMAVWNIALAISTMVLNVLVFVAVRRNNSLRFPSKLLLLNLISTDLGSGAVSQPLFAALLFAVNASSPYNNTTCFLLTSFSCAASLFCSAAVATMAAISLDRYAAFFFHLRYKEIVTTKRVSLFLVVSWSLSFAFASTFWFHFYLHRYLLISSQLLLCTTIIATYARIYRGLRRYHGPRVQDEAQATAAGSALDVAKYRRTAYSMAWVCGLFLVCYVPQLCVYLLRTYVFAESAFMAVLHNLTLTLALANACFNPLVYCFRLPEIRAEVIRSICKILPKNT